MEMCKTVKDAKELSDHLNGFVLNMHENGVSFIGKDLTNRFDSFERHKFGYEKEERIVKDHKWVLFHK